MPRLYKNMINRVSVTEHQYSAALQDEAKTRMQEYRFRFGLQLGISFQFPDESCPVLGCRVYPGQAAAFFILSRQGEREEDHMYKSLEGISLLWGFLVSRVGSSCYINTVAAAAPLAAARIVYLFFLKRLHFLKRNQSGTIGHNKVK